MSLHFESIFALCEENEIFKIKQDITSHPNMVYQRSHSGDSRIEGLDWYIEFLRNKTALSQDSTSDSPAKKSIRRSTPDMEGKHVTREHTSIQRNPEARRRCIEYYGCRCAVCGVDMSERYGEIGEGFIEVHHRNPIHLFDDTHPVDYKEDLIPLCPNCHAMIHKLEDPGDIETLKSMINEASFLEI